MNYLQRLLGTSVPEGCNSLNGQPCGRGPASKIKRFEKINVMPSDRGLQAGRILKVKFRRPSKASPCYAYRTRPGLALFLNPNSQNLNAFSFYQDQAKQ